MSPQNQQMGGPNEVLPIGAPHPPTHQQPKEHHNAHAAINRLKRLMPPQVQDHHRHYLRLTIEQQLMAKYRREAHKRRQAEELSYPEEDRQYPYQPMHLHQEVAQQQQQPIEHPGAHVMGPRGQFWGEEQNARSPIYQVQQPTLKSPAHQQPHPTGYLNHLQSPVLFNPEEDLTRLAQDLGALGRPPLGDVQQQHPEEDLPDPNRQHLLFPRPAPCPVKEEYNEEEEYDMFSSRRAEIRQQKRRKKEARVQRELDEEEDWDAETQRIGQQHKTDLLQALGATPDYNSPEVLDAAIRQHQENCTYAAIYHMAADHLHTRSKEVPVTKDNVLTYYCYNSSEVRGQNNQQKQREWSKATFAEKCEAIKRVGELVCEAIKQEVLTQEDVKNTEHLLGLNYWVQQAQTQMAEGEKKHRKDQEYVEYQELASEVGEQQQDPTRVAARIEYDQQNCTTTDINVRKAIKSHLHAGDKAMLIFGHRNVLHQLDAEVHLETLCKNNSAVKEVCNNINKGAYDKNHNLKQICVRIKAIHHAYRPEHSMAEQYRGYADITATLLSQKGTNKTTLAVAIDYTYRGGKESQFVMKPTIGLHETCQKIAEKAEKNGWDPQVCKSIREATTNGGQFLIDQDLDHAVSIRLEKLDNNSTAGEYPKICKWSGENRHIRRPTDYVCRYDSEQDNPAEVSRKWHRHQELKVMMAQKDRNRAREMLYPHKLDSNVRTTSRGTMITTADWDYQGHINNEQRSNSTPADHTDEENPFTFIKKGSTLVSEEISSNNTENSVGAQRDDLPEQLQRANTMQQQSKPTQRQEIPEGPISARLLGGAADITRHNINNSTIEKEINKASGPVPLIMIGLKSVQTPKYIADLLTEGGKLTTTAAQMREALDSPPDNSNCITETTTIDGVKMDVTKVMRGVLAKAADVGNTTRVRLLIAIHDEEDPPENPTPLKLKTLLSQIATIKRLDWEEVEKQQLLIRSRTRERSGTLFIAKDTNPRVEFEEDVYYKIYDWDNAVTTAQDNTATAEVQEVEKQMESLKETIAGYMKRKQDLEAQLKGLRAESKNKWALLDIPEPEIEGKIQEEEEIFKRAIEKAEKKIKEAKEQLSALQSNVKPTEQADNIHINTTAATSQVATEAKATQQEVKQKRDYLIYLLKRQIGQEGRAVVQEMELYNKNADEERNRLTARRAENITQWNSNNPYRNQTDGGLDFGTHQSNPNNYLCPHQAALTIIRDDDELANDMAKYKFKDEVGGAWMGIIMVFLQGFFGHDQNSSMTKGQGYKNSNVEQNPKAFREARINLRKWLYDLAKNKKKPTNAEVQKQYRETMTGHAAIDLELAIIATHIVYGEELNKTDEEKGARPSPRNMMKKLIESQAIPEFIRDKLMEEETTQILSIRVQSESKEIVSTLYTIAHRAYEEAMQETSLSEIAGKRVIVTVNTVADKNKAKGTGKNWIAQGLANIQMLRKCQVKNGKEVVSVEIASGNVADYKFDVEIDKENATQEEKDLLKFFQDNPQVGITTAESADKKKHALVATIGTVYSRLLITRLPKKLTTTRLSRHRGLMSQVEGPTVHPETCQVKLLQEYMITERVCRDHHAANAVELQRQYVSLEAVPRGGSEVVYHQRMSLIHNGYEVVDENTGEIVANGHFMAAENTIIRQEDGKLAQYKKTLYDGNSKAGNKVMSEEAYAQCYRGHNGKYGKTPGPECTYTTWEPQYDKDEEENGPIKFSNHREGPKQGSSVNTITAAEMFEYNVAKQDASLASCIDDRVDIADQAEISVYILNKKMKNFIKHDGSSNPAGWIMRCAKSKDKGKSHVYNPQLAQLLKADSGEHCIKLYLGVFSSIPAEEADEVMQKQQENLAASLASKKMQQDVKAQGKKDNNTQDDATHPSEAPELVGDDFYKQNAYKLPRKLLTSEMKFIDKDIDNLRATRTMMLTDLVKDKVNDKRTTAPKRDNNDNNNNPNQPTHSRTLKSWAAMVSTPPPQAAQQSQTGEDSAGGAQVLESADFTVEKYKKKIKNLSTKDILTEMETTLMMAGGMQSAVEKWQEDKQNGNIAWEEEAAEAAASVVMTWSVITHQIITTQCPKYYEIKNWNSEYQKANAMIFAEATRKKGFEDNNGNYNPDENALTRFVADDNKMEQVRKMYSGMKKAAAPVIKDIVQQHKGNRRAPLPKQVQEQVQEIRIARHMTKSIQQNLRHITQMDKLYKEYFVDSIPERVMKSSATSHKNKEQKAEEDDTTGCNIEQAAAKNHEWHNKFGNKFQKLFAKMATTDSVNNGTGGSGLGGSEGQQE